jgi:hypothetical protein
MNLFEREPNITINRKNAMPLRVRSLINQNWSSKPHRLLGSASARVRARLISNVMIFGDIHYLDDDDGYFDLYVRHLCLNNRLYQYNLTGNFRPTTRVRLSGQASIGRIKQNDAFVPYSSNPDFNDLLLPRTSLDGTLETSNLAARLTARLSPQLSLRLRMKYADRDNRTPIDFYTPVITDLLQRPETPNRPYSLKRSRYSAELSYRAHPSVSFIAGKAMKTAAAWIWATRSEQIWVCTLLLAGTIMILIFPARQTPAPLPGGPTHRTVSRPGVLA